MSKSEDTITLKCPTHGRLGAVSAAIKHATGWCKVCRKWYDKDGSVQT